MQRKYEVETDELDELVVEHLAAVDCATEPWAYLMPRAQVLVGRAVPFVEIEEILMRSVRARGWPETLRATLAHVIREAQHKQWRADALADREAARLENVEELKVVSLAKIKPKPMRWLWPEKIPLGAVTVIYGETGIGKTCLTLDLAARVSHGLPLADESQGPGAGQVLILNGGDPLEEQIVPRLMGCGADLENIAVINQIKVGAVEGASHERRFDLGRDLPALRAEVETLPMGRLVIIDSLEAFSGPRGLGRAQLRTVLTELETIATECGVAVVVLCAGTRCDLPVKNVWRVDCDKLDSGLRCLVPVRCNWGALPEGLSFRVTAGTIEWEARLESPSADRSRGATSHQEKHCQLKEHAAWLKSYLAAGPVSAKQVLAAASAGGWSAGQIRRAREALRVVCSKATEANGQWMWSLEKSPDRAAVRPVEIEDVEGGKDVEDAVRELVAA